MTLSAGSEMSYMTCSRHTQNCQVASEMSYTIIQSCSVVGIPAIALEV